MTTMRDEDGTLHRVLSVGWASAGPHDLLTLGLLLGANDMADARVRANELLRSFGSLNSLAEISREQLATHSGLSEPEVLRCLAWLELGRRCSGSGKGETELLMTPENVVRLLRHLRREKKEHFVVVMLDAKNILIKWSTIHIGTLTMSVVGPREVFREVIREGAGSIILVHNHPSGDPEPSPEDIDVTRKLDEIGKMLDIVVLDHIVIGDPQWVSLRERGVFAEKGS